MSIADAIFAAYERDAEDSRRDHLGASVIGRECERALWYSFRWATVPRFPGRIFRLFQRGQMEEAVFVADLKRIGAEVAECDPKTGTQWRFADIAGHMGGSMDAKAKGLRAVGPADLRDDEWVVVEMKTHGAKSFAKLSRGVRKAKPEHYAQMLLYMHWSGARHALYLAVCKDTDDLHGEWVSANPDEAQALLTKAARIIRSAVPLERVSERPDWWTCQYCEHRRMCHQGAIPEPSCRTCAHATPEQDGHGRWSCAAYQCDLSPETQRQGAHCPRHVFIPALLPWKAVDASEDAGWIEYDTPDGPLRNGPGGFASRELHANVALCLGADSVRDALRVEMGAEVAG